MSDLLVRIVVRPFGELSWCQGTPATHVVY